MIAYLLSCCPEGKFKIPKAITDGEVTVRKPPAKAGKSYFQTDISNEHSVFFTIAVYLTMSLFVPKSFVLCVP